MYNVHNHMYVDIYLLYVCVCIYIFSNTFAYKSLACFNFYVIIILYNMNVLVVIKYVNQYNVFYVIFKCIVKL